MNIRVMKFGGTSLATIDHIIFASKKIINMTRNSKVIVVLSAMAGSTNSLVNQIKKINTLDSSESDLVLATGEQISCGLMSIYLNKEGIKSRTWTAWQVPIYTNNEYGKARIENIPKENILESFKYYDVAIVTGFQGISKENKITTLGRGGSDTTAVAMAAAFHAEQCDIFTDVEGVFTANPSIVPNAKKIDYITYEEMLEMASLGAKVLQTRSVELAMKYNITIQVLSSQIDKEGTFVVNDNKKMEKEVVSGISFSKDEAKVTVSGLLDKPGVSAGIFGSLAEANINVDMIVQNISQDGKTANVTFTLPQSELKKAVEVLEKIKNKINFQSLKTDEKVAKVSAIGMGMRSQAGVATKMFRVLGEKNINIQAISTSEIKISVLIDQDYTELAVRSLHSIYGLDI
ncbi:MAG: Aspartate kinase [Alphaproteobacteria bacterium MarineAlpha5_Bin12]|nr:MAG: Aspartate kinase [Alphaproteobacteria bacterium MarineAlpha5_Bin12]|tara:strand:- start:1700 stop:2911 length:1212 start_codon:yes stop_codon:yes gene_type:complete